MEPVDGVGIRDIGSVDTEETVVQSSVAYPEDTEATRLE